MLCKKVIIKSSFFNKIITVQNGEEALQYFQSLKGVENQSNAIPQLIFLDLNMPVVGGWEFLEYLNTPEFAEFKTIQVQVVVLSSTIDPGDIEKSKQYPIVIDFLPSPQLLHLTRFFYPNR